MIPVPIPSKSHGRKGSRQLALNGVNLKRSAERHLDAISGRKMTHRPLPWLVLAGLVALAAPAYAQEEAPPLPDRNPGRSDTPAPDRKPIPAEAAEAPAPERKPTASEMAEVPAPETKPNLPGDQPTLPWQSPKVNAALAACAKMLEGVAIDYEQLPAIRHGLCGAPAPILVKSIGADPAVAIEPPATMNCTLAARLDAWLKDTVQPAAAALGSAVVKIHNISSYKCRNRYNGANTRISEHAFANALDVSEFDLASGERVTVLDNWRRPAPTPAPPPPPDPKPKQEADISLTKVKVEQTAPPAPPPVAKPPMEMTVAERKSAFVHEIHDDACKTFNTVLGPDANEAHRNHFHLDMKVRRYVKICE
jgi:hypothetical protein